jgi:hypothetical protein
VSSVETRSAGADEPSISVSTDNADSPVASRLRRVSLFEE